MAKAKAKAKFTFKKQRKETGLASVGSPDPDTTIKHNKQGVGYISAPAWNTKDNKWRIRLMVEQTNDPCNWRWVTLKAMFDSEPEARVFLQEYAEAILEKGLYHNADED
jgi:hypothetical protein